jgi:replicative DNA helicase
VPEEIDTAIAVEALSDQYTQEETLNKLSEFVDNIPHLDTSEIKNNLGEVLLYLEQKTDTSEEIFLMNDILLIDKEEIHSKVMLGLNNGFDAHLGGASLSELIMIGGERGSGKTIAACNVAANQYTQGNSVLFFSIEMRAREIFNRFLAILSGVKNDSLRRISCDDNEFRAIAKTRSDMFDGGSEFYNEFLEHGSYERFELDLLRSTKLKKDNQIVIVDNQLLTITDIDMNVQKFKTQFGDKLKVVVVDYVNQIQTNDLYDWKSQIKLSKELKNIARKHDVVLVTPYQIDKSGEARFAKGLLDAADIALVLEAGEDYINFSSTKTRNIAPYSFNAPIVWDNFQMLATDAIVPDSEPTKKDKGSAPVEDISF